MNLLGYLGEEQRNAFSRWVPVYFEEGRLKCVAYLCRYPILKLNLAIVEADVEADNPLVFCGRIEGFSLRGYDGVPCDDLKSGLRKIMGKEECAVSSLYPGLGEMIDAIVESSVG